MKDTPLHDKVIAILKKTELASEREALLKELFAGLLVKPDGGGEITMGDILLFLNEMNTAKQGDSPDLGRVLYPSITEQVETSHDGELEGFDEQIKDFARGFYNQLKGEEVEATEEE